MNVEELREELRRGRTEKFDESSGSIGATSGNFEGNGGSDHRSEQPISSDLLGPGTKNDTINVTHNGLERGPDEESFRGRSTNRRSRKDSSSPVSDSTSTTTGKRRRVGKLESEDAIPTRTAYEEVPTNALPIEGRRKETTKKEKAKPLQRGKASSEDREPIGKGKDEERKQGFAIPWFKEGNTLTEAEIVTLEPSLINALGADFYYIDQFIWNRTMDTSEAPIWSDLDEEDVTVLARIMLKQGKHSPQAATMVRSIVGGSDYISALMLTIPRVIKTVDRFKTAPRQPKKSFLQRKQEARGIAVNEY